MRVKCFVTYSEDTGILGVKGNVEDAQQLVTDFLAQRSDGTDEPEEWLYGAHGVHTTTGKQWKARFFVERWHYDLDETEDSRDAL